MSDIVAVRRFKRTVTARIGVLEDRYLARGRPLGQARLLWEIGVGTGADPASGTDVRDLRARLDLDSGYVSRLLRALETDGLVTTAGAGADARVRTARLTSAGRVEFGELERLSDEAARDLLQPLSERQRERLVTAMGEVERLLLASQVSVEEADATSAAARFCAREYYTELASRFETGFDPTVGGAVADPSITPPSGLLLVATLRGDPVGCGALTFDAGDAEIKRVWAAPAMRGLGLGRRLVCELEHRARAAGTARIMLDTNACLTEAIAMYRALGYHEIPAYNDNPYAQLWFEKALPTEDSA
ncbi:helix-turn-helix domain-containing GNAT family N-acetyltransferase [Tsukamurella sp. 8F]|uniref:bifunctional helix-turn-helix transcriptional regulator/GNAT family N-acetyltransferase n=1 Tax=unclassified Tsukamurella TaxID=2633480 RepID=UPI0023BA21CF|nr:MULTISPECIES: helix-turn-helix domain-containing GNAT family N-acetyltransferase [unclassified Tsukamurella]MDF0528611.1 helix-turn-helix domain-containing GNAT family N-acetyltransferase [Tsukamurella sp. 8J]MDF0585573.1 helix-turn-helix domain-containing GNAT family N-acetyltransferase [Tsukamurella sp. 8F]